MEESTTTHTAVQTILLHLLPGVMIAIVYFAFTPVFIHFGFPNSANILDAILAMVPIQIGLLLFVTKQKTGTYHVRSQIPYLEKSSLKDYLIFIPLLAVWAILVGAVLTPVEHSLRDSLFSFIPSEYMIGNYDISYYSNEKIIITAMLLLIFNGIVAPFVEEIYFRGYLLPRINLSPKKAVVVNAILFSLYHFFSPWYFLSRVLMTIPLYYLVVKKKNIRFSVIAHTIANCTASLSILLSLV